MTTTRWWTNREIAAVRDLYATHTSHQIGVMLDRSGQAVRDQAKRLGLRKRGPAAQPATPRILLRAEIAAARAEAATAPLYRSGPWA